MKVHLGTAYDKKEIRHITQISQKANTNTEHNNCLFS